jgi:hypothetical protein
MSKEKAGRKTSKNLIRIIELTFKPEDVEGEGDVNLDLTFKGGDCSYTFRHGPFGGGGGWERGRVVYKNVTRRNLKTEVKYLEFTLSTYLRRHVKINHNISELEKGKQPAKYPRSY